MREELRVSGTIAEGGGLLLPMNEVRDWCSHFPGQRVVVTFALVGKEVTAAQRGYYYKYIVPEAQAALARLGDCRTEEGVEFFLREQCPFLRTPEGLPRVEQLNRKQMSDFLDWLKYYCADNLHIFIEDSRLI